MTDDDTLAARMDLLRDGRPSPALLIAEWRALLEAGALFLQWPMVRRAPRGDGHPVLVLPGLWAGDASTWPLRRYLRRHGFAAHGWGLRLNRGPRDGVLEALRLRLCGLHRSSGRCVSLVGWSLGGLFARELAREMPYAVRQVITLGSPLYGHPRRTTRSWLAFRAAMVGARAQDHTHLRRDGAPPVPTTSVFSRGDGIVSWRACVERPGPQVQNVETFASHIGYGVNGLVWWLLADRLAQPVDAWQPFTPPPGLAAWYRLRG